MLESIFTKIHSKETPTQVFSCDSNTVVFLQVASSAFLRCSFRKIFLNFWRIGRKIYTAEIDLSRVAPATLVLSVSVMDNFLENLQ